MTYPYSETVQFKCSKCAYVYTIVNDAPFFVACSANQPVMPLRNPCPQCNSCSVVFLGIVQDEEWPDTIGDD
jgi:hypothetical protein